MKITMFSLLLATALLGACSSGVPEPAQPMPGADRDAHGCIPSAGYTWCARTNQCERPWELAKQHSLENTPQAFEAFCRTPASGG